MKCLTHLGSHADVSREAAGINGDGRSHAEPFTHVVLRHHPRDTAIFQNRLLDGVPDSQRSTGCNSAPREMLVDAAHIQDAGNRRIIVQLHFTMRGDKSNVLYWMIEVFRDAERLHIAHPASSTRMDGIADFVLAFQYDRSRTLLSGSLSSRQSCRTTANNQNIAINWHVYPSLRNFHRFSQLTSGCWMIRFFTLEIIAGIV